MHDKLKQEQEYQNMSILYCASNLIERGREKINLTEKFKFVIGENMKRV